MTLQPRPTEQQDSTLAATALHPIIFRIDSAVPRKWVPWITRGIEAWNPLFQAVGSGNTIVVQDGAPSAGPQQAVSCAVHWSTDYFDGAATIIGSFDSQTGEVSNCDMTLNRGTVSLAQSYGFLYLGGFDPRMRYPYPDSVAGRLLQLMVSHEAGHSLGFTENFNAGSVYPTDSLRSAAFVHRMGVVGSIMSYTFFDAVAQPEDNVAPEDLLSRPSEYDRWLLGTRYGSDSVKAASGAGPQSLAAWPVPPGGAYAIGGDLAKSAEYVSRNLARSAPLIDAQRDTSGTLSGGSLPEQLRDAAVTLWGVSFVSAIDAIIGGTAPQPVIAQGSPDVPVDSARQVETLRFAIAHVLYGQDAFVQRVFGRAPTDTSLVLFDAVPAGWTVNQWQYVQDALVSHIVKKDRSGQVAAQAGKTHVLPVYCAELASLDRALTAAVAKATRPEARSQAEKLQKRVHALFEPEKGDCVATAPPKP